jgi:quercetin dioxygenase-like cupin family protein
MFFSEAELKTKQPLEGVSLRAVYGDKTMLTIFNLEPNAVIPTHAHPHEQISYVLEGALEFTLEGETRVLRPGDGVLIPSGQKHGARVLDQRTKVVDGWYPIRDDYK